MRRPFKFRYVNEVAGIFVLFTVFLAVLIVLLVGRSQHWFESSTEIMIEFTEEGTYGLRRGAEVHLLGTPIGTISRIEVDDHGVIRGVLNVRGNFLPFIRTDSEAVVKRKFGIMGESFIEITTGLEEPLADDRAVIPLRKDTEINEMVKSAVEMVSTVIVPAINELEGTLAEFRGFAEDMRNPENDLQRSLAAFRGVLEGLEGGEGTLGRVLRDPELADELEEILVEINTLTTKLSRSADRVDQILGDVRGATEGLPQTARAVHDEMLDVPGIVLQAQTTLREFEQLMASMQRHWFLRRYVEKREGVEMLPPPPLMEVSP